MGETWIYLIDRTGVILKPRATIPEEVLAAVLQFGLALTPANPYWTVAGVFSHDPGHAQVIQYRSDPPPRGEFSEDSFIMGVWKAMGAQGPAVYIAPASIKGIVRH